MNPAFQRMSKDEASRFMIGKQHASMRRQLAAMIGSRTVVDIGCGKGIMVSELYSPARYIGVDISPELLDLARANNPGYSFLCFDASSAALPFADKSFECALMVSVLEHQPDLDSALAVYHEALRVAEEVIVLWHTPPVYPNTEIILVQAELDRPINQNHYKAGSFDREGIQVEFDRVDGFLLWLARSH